jgi:hypothetical protein
MESFWIAQQQQHNREMTGRGNDSITEDQNYSSQQELPNSRITAQQKRNYSRWAKTNYVVNRESTQQQLVGRPHEGKRCVNNQAFFSEFKWTQFDTLCKVVQEIQADIICGQEDNVDTSQQVARSSLYHTLRQYWQRFRLQTGSTQQLFVQWYKSSGR